MARQALVLGLGQFGMALARALAESGVEVLAVDIREDRVQAVASIVAQAVAFDATDEEALARTEPARMNVCACAIGGDQSREGAIIATALLRQMGAPHVIARATDDVTARILRLVGAHEVVNPEEAFGRRLAARILFAGIVDEIPLGGDLVISELRPPPTMVGHTLAELGLPDRFDVTVVAVRRADERGHPGADLPRAELSIGADDLMVVVGRRENVQRMLRATG